MSLDEARARKDAVRDCLSALEAFLKRASGTQDIRAATRELRSLGIGPDAIVKDGLSIWDRIHELYPDVRHGEPTGSDMSKAEALYWVERITAYVRFLSADGPLQDRPR